MTQDYSECKHYVEDGTCRIEIFTKMSCDSIYCKDNSNCYYKQWKETEKQLKISLEDNYTLGKRIESIENQLKKILNYAE